LAFRGAERPAQEHLAWLAVARASPPYRHAAEPPVGRRVGPLNSVEPEDATGRRRKRRCLRFERAAARLPEWVLARVARASESSAPQRWAGERLAS
jgi:hypothetical protein